MEERALYLHPPVWMPIVVAVLAGGMYIAGKYVETRAENLVTISVSGEGKVSAVPDIAQLSFGMQTGRRPTAQDSMAALEESMKAIIDAVKKAGVEDKDIRTESLSLYPAYDWKEGEQIPRGFEASQNLVVKVRDMEKISAVLGAATTGGANQVGGVSFTIDDPEELQAEARKEAIEKAREKAETLAAQLGKTLGELRGFSEGGGGVMTPMYARTAMAEGMGGGGMDIPLPSGEQEIQIQVSLMYSLK